MKRTKSLYHGHRFPVAIISLPVRWYFRFQLSLRDVEESLFECGVIVSYETIRRWCDKFGVDFSHRIMAAERKPGGAWHLDEMFVTLRGEPYLLWQAVDEHGTELDILLQKRRDKAAAKRFFRRVLRSCPVRRKIVADPLRSYPAAETDILKQAKVKHLLAKAAARVKNRPRTATNPHASVSRACANSATANARVLLLHRAHPPALLSQAASAALRSTANSSWPASHHGASSPKSPRIRQPHEAAVQPSPIST